jgi:hypothetical protein
MAKINNNIDIKEHFIMYTLAYYYVEQKYGKYRVSI